MDTNETDADEWSKIPHAAPPEDSETALPAFTTTRRGYDQAQVNAYLELVTGRLQDVEAEVSKLRSEADQAGRQRDAVPGEQAAAHEDRDAALRERPAADEDTYEQVSGRVRELMVALNRDVQKLRGEAQGEAQAEAEHILDHARGKATRMLSEAEEIRVAAELAAAQVRDEARRSLAELTAQCDSMVADLRLSFARSLDTIGSLASSIGDEGETLREDGSEARADSSTSSQDEQSTPLVLLPETEPDRSAQSG
jgi:colicin import membrane protein